MRTMHKWTPEEEKRLIELRKTHTQKLTAMKLTEEFGFYCTDDMVKNREAMIKQRKHSLNEKRIEGKESIEINSDGTQSSEKLIEMSLEQSKDVEFLLRVHGYDPEVWELVSARNNIWNSYSKQDGIQTLFSSKIVVRPKDSGASAIPQLIEAMKYIKPVIVKTKAVNVIESRLLEMPIFDAHFGISDYEYYKPTQMTILDIIGSRAWEENLFIIGQDTLHNDDFRGRTSNGTQIETVDMVKAWNDCRMFYEPLIEKALQFSRSVKVMYSKGNHDESMSWAFVQFLKARFPQVTFDDEMLERKVHTFGQNFIGVTHGDKARKNLHNIFPTEFPHEWSKAKNREIHMGHYHVEDGKDIFGMMVRTLATRNKTDKWHRDNGFVGAHKRFMLFEYNEEELKSIHYV
ncbi:MAG TPA: hypothetical protein VE710_18325 [Candidatus Bathyarchaeia archaeon]|nr:hypothetical protein [Candidatus Bathyarchaeia archaeon]